MRKTSNESISSFMSEMWALTLDFRRLLLCWLSFELCLHMHTTSTDEKLTWFTSKTCETPFDSMVVWATPENNMQIRWIINIISQLCLNDSNEERRKKEKLLWKLFYTLSLNVCEGPEQRKIKKSNRKSPFHTENAKTFSLYFLRKRNRGKKKTSWINCRVFFKYKNIWESWKEERHNISRVFIIIKELAKQNVKSHGIERHMKY